MQTLEEALMEAVEKRLVAGKYTLGKSSEPFKLSMKTLGKSAVEEAKEKLKEKGITDFKMYQPDKTLVYFISGDKIVAKIFTFKPHIKEVVMAFYE